MDTRPIGIFDSGLGGLTVAKEIGKVLPQESTIYIGDTARVPYGNRSGETVTGFSRELVAALIAKNVKAIVVACATASSVALKTLQAENPEIPILGVIDAAAKQALAVTKSGKIGVIGTRATINSKSFEIATHSSLLSQACPLFVPMIEEGILEGPITDAVIHHYLHPFKQNDVDTLILGCTHYPLIAGKIKSYLPHIQCINMGESTAQNLHQTLASLKINGQNPQPTHTYYVTDITDSFPQVANRFLESDQPIHPEKITL